MVGKILGPLDASVFSAQLNSLRDGDILRFLAPVNLSSLDKNQAGQTKNALLLTIRKRGENIEIENLGEYWNIIEKEFPRAKNLLLGIPLKEMSGELSDNIAKNKETIVDDKGDSIVNIKKSNSLNDLFSSLKTSLSGRKRVNVTRGTSLTDTLVSQANLLQTDNSDQALIKKIIATIAVMIMKLIGSLFVELERNPSANIGDILKINKTNNNISASDAAWNKKDDDGDGVLNGDDVCPKTYSEDINAINRDRSSGLLGCSCSDYEYETLLYKTCPVETCEYDKITDEPQECKDGRYLAYSCASIRNNSEDCANSKSIIGEVTEYTDKRGIPWGEGNESYSMEPKGRGTAQDIKKVLLNIYRYDPLRYAMIFRFTEKIIDLSKDPNSENFNGFSTGCSTMFVRFDLPRTNLSATLVHEATHNAQSCIMGFKDVAIDERVAIANEIGSLCQNMEEFSGQSRKINYRGKEVRGYISRLLKKANPIDGYLDTGEYYGGLNYAADQSDQLVQGPYCYGDPSMGMYVGLKEDEEEILDKIMQNKGECMSKPPSDLPQIPACKNAHHILSVGGNTWN